MIRITFGDNSTEETTFGAAGSGNENLVVARKDRNGHLTTYAYDAHGRQILETTAADDPAVAVTRSCTYLVGSNQVTSCTTAGETVSYFYVYRGRP